MAQQNSMLVGIFALGLGMLVLVGMHPSFQGMAIAAPFLFTLEPVGSPMMGSQLAVDIVLTTTQPITGFQ
ncbi:MAG TPA: hypothetical protein VJK52_04120, partial [Candidatus Nanoarchaeia archaeon]|nr:hypothetical protein [Candidatus Nanoarchaeia archaeon]